MTVCTVCGKILSADAGTCPSGHRALSDLAAYVKLLKKEDEPVTVILKNGLSMIGTIEMVTASGFYLDDSTLAGIDNEIICTWEEIDTIVRQ